MDYFKKEDKKSLEAFSYIPGFKHIVELEPKSSGSSSEPKLIEALQDAIIAYSDCQRYEFTLDKLLEDFDESIELYNADSWMKLALGNDEIDDPLIEEYDAIRIAASNMSHLCRRAEERCKMMLRTALHSQDYQVKIFGRTHKLSALGIEEFVSSLFESICEYDFDYISGEANEECFHFIAFVNDKLDEFYKAHK